MLVCVVCCVLVLHSILALLNSSAVPGGVECVESLFIQVTGSVYSFQVTGGVYSFQVTGSVYSFQVTGGVECVECVSTRGHRDSPVRG